MPEAAFQLIPLAKLHESPLNPRRHFNEKALAELADSIRAHGVLTPLLARPNSAGYEIAAGHRRFRAATAAGMADVPCIVRPMTDTQFLEIITIENLQREDVHPLEEAQGYQALMEKAGYDVAAIAAKVGKSESYVYQRLKLAELVPEAQKPFLADELSAGHAILIARLQPKDQVEAVKYCLRDRYNGEACGVRELARWIEQNVHLDLHKAPWKKDNADLVPEAGPCTNCPKRTGFTPALFPDIAKKDTCTDPACFKTKMQAHIDERIAQAHYDDGEKLLKLHNGHLNYKEEPPKGSIGRDDFRIIEKAKDRCEHAQRGVVIVGDQQGKVLTVCADKKCKQHHGRNAGSFQRDPKEIAREKREQERKQLELDSRTRILDAIVATVPAGKLSRKDLMLVATQLFGHLGFDTGKALLKWLLPDAPKDRVNDWHGKDTLFAEHIATLHAGELLRLLFTVALFCGREKPMKYGGNGGFTYDKAHDELLQAAERYSVDADAIERQVTEEHAAKKAAKEAKGKKAKTAGEVAHKLHASAKAAETKKAKRETKAAARKTKASAAGEEPVRRCRVCGCTDLDCRGCIERTGEPCHWVEQDLCSACVEGAAK